MNLPANNVMVISLLISAIIWTACYISEPDESILTINTDAITYSPDDTMTVIFENNSGRRYLLESSGCETPDEKPLPRLTYERREGGRWINAGGPACPRIYVPPVELKYSESYSVRFRAYVSAMEFVPGMYRLRFYFSDDNDTPKPPEREHYSNVFRIE